MEDFVLYVIVFVVGEGKCMKFWCVKVLMLLVGWLLFGYVLVVVCILYLVVIYVVYGYCGDQVQGVFVDQLDFDWVEQIECLGIGYVVGYVLV